MRQKIGLGISSSTTLESSEAKQLRRTPIIAGIQRVSLALVSYFRRCFSSDVVHLGEFRYCRTGLFCDQRISDLHEL